MNFLESVKFNFLFQFHLQMYIYGLMFSFWNKVNLLKTGSDEWLGKVKRILSAFIYNVAPVNSDLCLHLCIFMSYKHEN